MTKLIVAGSRSIENTRLVGKAISETPYWPEIDEIVHGGADGVDSAASEWVKRKKHEALGGPDEKVFEAEWDKYGKGAGPVRNQHMAEYGDALLAIWDGESRGTRDMINKALNMGMDVTVRVIDNDN